MFLEFTWCHASLSCPVVYVTLPWELEVFVSKHRPESTKASLILDPLRLSSQTPTTYSVCASSVSPFMFLVHAYNSYIVWNAAQAFLFTLPSSHAECNFKEMPLEALLQSHRPRTLDTSGPWLGWPLPVSIPAESAASVWSLHCPSS